jgi:hypothetical protein
MHARRLAILMALVVGAFTCRADWGQAESPEFTLDTTVPEPAMVVVGAAALLLWRRR